MKITIMPCAQCIYMPGPDCDFCERYDKWVSRLASDDLVIFEIIDSEKAQNFTCPHCGKWFRVG